MDEPRIVAPGVRRLTVNLDEDDVALYQGQWPIPHGVALHAYLVQGEKTVVIDPWDEGGYGPEELEADLALLGLSWKDVTAVAFTRAPEPSLFARLGALNPNLINWGLPAPGEFWSLSGVLFSGDAFSGLGWVEDELWAEDLGEHDARFFEDEALRWYSSRPVAPAPLPDGIQVIAPAHGCLWRTPENALKRASQFDEWGRGDALDEVALVWPEGRDAEADALVGGVLDAGWGLNLFRVPCDATALAAGARRSSLVVVAADVDQGFLSGMTKDVWVPETSSPDALRTSVVRRLEEL